jgi:gas vesicle protein
MQTSTEKEKIRMTEGKTMRNFIRQIIKLYERWSMMKDIFSFLLGAAFGAIIALLFAPQSGAELRANIQATAEKDFQKLQSQWQVELEKLNQRLDQLQAGSQGEVQEGAQEDEVAPDSEEAVDAV